MPFPTLRLPWKYLVSLALLLLGFESRAIEPPPTNSGQSTTLHGTGALEHVNIPLADAQPPLAQGACQWQSLRLTNGNFIGTLKDKSECEGVTLIGTRFFAPLAGELVEFQIQGAIQKPPGVIRDPRTYRSSMRPPKYEYQVTWKFAKETGEPFRYLCPATDKDKKKVNRYAFAVLDAWSTAGELIENGSYFTFACVPFKELNPETGGTRLVGGGAIAKCIMWGYPPWDRLKNHRVCVRMATADYCGEGKVNTLDGTSIAYATTEELLAKSKMGFVMPSSPEQLNPGPLPALPKHYFEAAWGIDSCGRVKALCLSKKRWDTLALDGTCVDRKILNDLVEKGKDELRVCDMDVKSLENNGAVFFSYSTFIDRALRTFVETRLGHPPRFLTTSDVQTIGVFSFIPRPKEFAYYSEHIRLEGTIIGGDVANADMPESVKDGVVPLYQCANKDDQGYYLMTKLGSENPCRFSNGIEPTKLEGYILHPDRATLKVKPLYLWKRTAINDYYVTSTAQPPGPYKKAQEKPIGYMVVMAQLAEVMAKMNSVLPP